MKKVDLYGEPINDKVEDKWITVKNGAHVLVDGEQNKAEAIEEHFEKRNAHGENAKNEYNIAQLLGREYIGYKGQAAIDKLMREKQGHIKAAFHRDDIGDIDLLWGCDTFGLQHILQRREDQGINSAEFVKGLSDVIEKGTFVKRNDRGNFEFVYDSKVAIVSPELSGNKLTFLLTAFKTHSKNRHCN